MTTSGGDRNRKSVLDPDNPQSDFDGVVNAHQIFVRCRFSLHKSLRLMDQISMRFGSVADSGFANSSPELQNVMDPTDISV